ncbi:peptide transporter family 1-like isoform X4 [Aphis gossypii]|uniref:peptide transporter family 1-like isoform X4 n=1 Tax=Aphis gossypii TaxID=80765 RepID=UPI002158E5BF|nr:peptide transporter family 1-like isoform X4 [Aphis gossypii]
MNNCPMRMYFVIIMEFLERFSFSSLRSALSFYIRDVLLYNERQAVDIYHVFMMLCYLSAIIGGLVGNSDYGKYKTILTFSILYWIGILMLFWSTVQIKNTLLTNFMALYSLVFISIGVGAIKCCIAAFGVDQLIGNNQNVTSTQVHGFFSTFYFSIHLGVLFGMITSPIINKILLYKGHNINGYIIRFGLVVITMSISISVFVCGNPYYFFKKSLTNILPKMIKCILFSLWKRLTSRCKETKNKHWLESAKDSFSNETINDTKKTLHILYLYIPLSVFWSLFDQQHTTWIFQASRTSDNLLGMPFSVYMLQVVNPLLVLFTIPLMDRLVYPYLKSHKLFKYPLKRMLLGGGIAGIAFIFAGCLEKCLEENMQDVSIHNASTYTKARSANIWISNLGLQKFNATGYFIFDHNIITPEYMKIRIPKRKNQTYFINDKGIIKKSIVLLVMENSLFKEDNTTFKSPSAVLVPENVFMTSAKKHPYIIHIIVPSNENRRLWLRIKNLTLESMSNNKIKIFEESFCVSQFQNNTILKIPSGLYTLTIHYMDKKQTPISMNVLKLETESIYIYRNEYDNNLINSRFKSNEILQNRVLSKVWLLPQFVCMTFGETLFAMTGLSFSFSETPESMKTVSISMWYFCVALGNLTVICINKFIAFEKKVVK